VCSTARTAARPIPEGMTIYRLRRPLKYVPRECTCDGLRVRIKFMGLYGRPLLALAGFLVVTCIIGEVYNTR